MLKSKSLKMPQKGQITSKYKSDVRGELVPTVIIEFHDLPDLWLTEQQYKYEVKFTGLIKSQGFHMRDVKKVHHLLKNPNKYPTQAWEG